MKEEKCDTRILQSVDRLSKFPSTVGSKKVVLYLWVLSVMGELNFFLEMQNNQTSKQNADKYGLHVKDICVRIYARFKFVQQNNTWRLLQES